MLQGPILLARLGFCLLVFRTCDLSAGCALCHLSCQPAGPGGPAVPRNGRQPCSVPGAPIISLSPAYMHGQYVNLYLLSVLLERKQQSKKEK